MKASDKKSLTFWGLVLGIFVVVFLFWLPGFLQSIQTLTAEIGAKALPAQTAVKDEITPQIEELKKSFDTFVKQLPKELPVAEQEPAQRVGPQEPPVVQKPLSTREYCEQNKGINQQRTSERYGTYAVCIFFDGSECEQKMFQAGVCAPGKTMVAEDLMKSVISNQ